MFNACYSQITKVPSKSKKYILSFWLWPDSRCSFLIRNPGKDIDTFLLKESEEPGPIIQSVSWSEKLKEMNVNFPGKDERNEA